MNQKGVSLIEILLSIILLVAAFVALITTFSKALVGSGDAEGVVLATYLAEDLMEEIRRKGFDDPDGSPVWGPEADEDANDRTTFDDVDDYDNWSKSPPEKVDGTAYDGTGGTPDYNRFTRAVTVVNVPVNDFDTTTPLSDTTTQDHAKRITVTVSWGSSQNVVLKTVLSQYQADPR